MFLPSLPPPLELKSAMHKPEHTIQTSNAKPHSAHVNRRNGRNPKEQSASRRRRVTEEAMEDAVEFFQTMPALSFVFVGDRGPHAVGPNLISAIELAVCTFNDFEYAGPYPESEFKAKKLDASKRREEIIAAVKEEVRRLRKVGASFIICWQAFGESDPHVDHSDDYADVDVLEYVAGFLQDEVRWRIVP